MWLFLLACKPLLVAFPAQPEGPTELWEATGYSGEVEQLGPWIFEAASCSGGVSFGVGPWSRSSQQCIVRTVSPTSWGMACKRVSHNLGGGVTFGMVGMSAGGAVYDQTDCELAGPGMLGMLTLKPDESGRLAGEMLLGDVVLYFRPVYSLEGSGYEYPGSAGLLVETKGKVIATVDFLNGGRTELLQGLTDDERAGVMLGAVGLFLLRD
jgi:hypothetical protein